MENKKKIYYEYFENNILPVIKPFEEYRIKTVKKVVFSSLLFFLSGFIFAGLFIYNSINNFINPLFLPVLLFLMYVFILHGIIKAIVEGKEFQKKLVKEVLPLFFVPVANFKIWPENDIESVIDSKLFPNFNTQENDLSFFGLYKNTNINISETHLTQPVKSSVKTDLFKGTLIKLELPVSLNNHVVLISKNETKYNKFHQINPHLRDFNRYLYAFAKNSENTGFINEDFWKIIKRFGQLYTAKGFLFSFKNDVVLIALRQKRPMQFGFLFRSLLKAKNYDDLIERFIVIYDLIDNLNNSF